MAGHHHKEYQFRLILTGSPALTDEIADALFAAGCDDGTPGTIVGVFSIDFHRVANSLEMAIQSAIANVNMNAAGYEVERVEIDTQAMSPTV